MICPACRRLVADAARFPEFPGKEASWDARAEKAGGGKSPRAILYYECRKFLIPVKTTCAAMAASSRP